MRQKEEALLVTPWRYRLWAFCIALVVIGLPSASHAQRVAEPHLPALPRAYAVIVANNQSVDGSRARLRFADDDGVRFAELFKSQGIAAQLLTVLDEDSQRLFPEHIGSTRPPSRENLKAALATTFAAMTEQKRQGLHPEFYFVFTGHGDVRGSGEGILHLQDDYFTRADLFAEVIKASPAAFNHIIIDACQSYFMVAARGAQATPAPDQSVMIRHLVAAERLSAFPNTGVILSTNAAAEVHEWGRIEAGVFSHEVRSALSGAADANEDGAIDYDEVGAFLAAANADLPNPKTRLRAHTQAPRQDLGHPVLNLMSDGPRLEIPAHVAGHFYLEDDRAIRFADFHKGQGAVLRLHLVNRPRYFLRTKGKEYLLELGGDVPPYQPLAFQSLHASARAYQEKGATEDAFANYLFATPFDHGFVEGFRQRKSIVVDAPAPTLLSTDRTAPDSSGLRVRRSLAIGFAGVGVGLGVTAGVFEYFAQNNARRYRSGAGSLDTLAGYEHSAATQHENAKLLGTLALTAAASSAALFVYDLWSTP